MRRAISILIVAFLVAPVSAQQPRITIESAEQVMLPVAPATQPSDRPERDDGTGRFYNVTQPMLFVWPAEKPNGTAIIVCPGGSYDHVTMELEGQRIAKWLNPMGVTVFGLKYRTRPPSQDAAADAMADGLAAVKLVRSRAMVWKIEPNRIGMLGYSAGSNLVLNVASHFEKDSRPDFVVMLCTWPNRKTLESFPLSKDSPPAFLAHAKDDRTAPVQFGQDIKKKLDELSVPAEIYLCDTGGHAAFHVDQPRANTEWKPAFLEWMRKRELLPKQ